MTQFYMVNDSLTKLLLGQQKQLFRSPVTKPLQVEHLTEVDMHNRSTVVDMEMKPFSLKPNNNSYICAYYGVLLGKKNISL